MFLDEILLHPDTVIDALSIYSLDGGFYTVEATMAGRKEYIVNAHTGYAKHFRSVTHVRQTLENVVINNAVLVHASSYSEMVGLDERYSNEPMALPLNW